METNAGNLRLYARFADLIAAGASDIDKLPRRLVTDALLMGAEFARHTTVPIALGERLYSRWDFKRVFEANCVDVVQPDLSHAGGISECRRIAAAAEAYDIALAPHCPLGPLALAACMQVALGSPSFVIQEMSLGIHYNADGNDLLTYMTDPAVFNVRDGIVAALAAPGLVIGIDEDRVRAATRRPTGWRNPVWRGPDGVAREW